MDYFVRIRVQESVLWCFLLAMSGSCGGNDDGEMDGCANLEDYSYPYDTEHPYGTTSDDPGSSGGVDASWPGCEDVPFETRIASIEIIDDLRGALSLLRSASAAREQLAFEAVGGARLALVGHVRTEEQPWTFDEGMYEYASDGLNLSTVLRADDVDFSEPSAVLIHDVLDVETYLIGSSFESTSPPEAPIGSLPLEGTIRFEARGPYAALLAIEDPDFASPYPVVLEEFLELNTVVQQAAAAPLWRVDALSTAAIERGRVRLDATAAPASLSNLLAGATANWSVDGLEGEHPQRGQVLQLQEWNLRYQGRGGNRTLYPRPALSTMAGTLVGEVVVRVTGGPFDYTAELVLAADGTTQLLVICDTD